MENDHGSFDPELFEVFRSLFREFAGSVSGGKLRNGDVSLTKIS